MKFKITMKDHDGVYESINDAAFESALEVKGIGYSERERLIESRREELEESIKKWFQYNEYVTIEIDTEAGTAIVCKN